MGYLFSPGTGPYTGSAPDANGNPTSFLFTGLPLNGPGLPDNIFQEFFMEASNITVPGAFLDTVTAVSGSGTSVSPQIVTLASGGAWTTNQWQYRILSLYSRAGGLPVVSGNVAIASSTSSTLTMADIGLGGSRRFGIGDVVVMRLMNSIGITLGGACSPVSTGAPGSTTRLIYNNGGALAGAAGITTPDGLNLFATSFNSGLYRESGFPRGGEAEFLTIFNYKGDEPPTTKNGRQWRQPWTSKDFDRHPPPSLVEGAKRRMPHDAHWKTQLALRVVFGCSGIVERCCEALRMLLAEPPVAPHRHHDIAVGRHGCGRIASLRSSSR
jgi:hypothetical protein